MQFAAMYAFPLGKTGGLIEATRTPMVNRLGGCGFRWVKPAASLKPEERPANTSESEFGFRWVKPAASLKRALDQPPCS